MTFDLHGKTIGDQHIKFQQLSLLEISCFWIYMWPLTKSLWTPHMDFHPRTTQLNINPWIHMQKAAFQTEFHTMGYRVHHMHPWTKIPEHPGSNIKGSLWQSINIVQFVQENTWEEKQFAEFHTMGHSTNMGLWTKTFWTPPNCPSLMEHCVQVSYKFLTAWRSVLNNCEYMDGQMDGWMKEWQMPHHYNAHTS